MAINQTAHNLPPWQDPPIPWFMRVIGYAIIFCLGGLIIWSVLDLTTAIAIAMAQGLFTSQATLQIGYILQHIVLPVTGILTGIIGWLMVRRYAFGHDDFRSQSLFPSGLLGRPIVIYMDQPIKGWGAILFAPDGLKLQAEAPKFAILNVFDIVRDTLYQLARLLVKRLLHTQSVNYVLEYSQVTEVKVKGRHIVLFSPDGKVKKTKVQVSSSDGERLYRELNAHFPGAIEEWRHLL